MEAIRQMWREAAGLSIDDHLSTLLAKIWEFQRRTGPIAHEDPRVGANYLRSLALEARVLGLEGSHRSGLAHEEEFDTPTVAQAELAAQFLADYFDAHDLPDPDFVELQAEPADEQHGAEEP